MTQIIKVLIPRNGLPPLDYQSKDVAHKIGELVLVPFRNKEITGIIWAINQDSSHKKLKTISSNQPFKAELDVNTLQLIQKISDYYLAPLGTIAKLFLPVEVNEKPIIGASQDITKEFVLPDLSEEQFSCLSKILATKKPVIIKGVTGSGKTEVYFHVLEKVINDNKQALIMLPEIALGSQIIKRFEERFGFPAVIWNSTISKPQKKRILRGIIKGDIKIVIGARSSLFLPYPNLGLIVIDEEHDASYKQNDNVTYNARDMAVLKAHLFNFKVLLVSATPSIETIQNSKLGKYDIIELSNRFGNAHMPNVEIVDMRQENLPHNSWLSSKLVSMIRETISRNEQVLLFLNRRGYAPLMICSGCGYRFDCKSCSASMVVHKSAKKMECHHCGLHMPLANLCPKCEEDNSLRLCGPGVERIAEEINYLFPGKKIATLSKDQITKNGTMEEILSQMSDGRVDILIGTQIVSKGHHFPNLTLVGIIDADVGFLGADLRSGERTYQLLHQVGGRAGREDKKGKVVIQTYFPENSVLQALKNGLEQQYIEAEIENRREATMPPFSKIAQILLIGKNANNILQIAKKLALQAPKSEAKILGPAEALMFKLSEKYRYRMLVIAPRNFNIQKYITVWLSSFKIPASCQVKIDIDPQNFA
jgi:primosomal protein N' (replication factor Y)